MDRHCCNEPWSVVKVVVWVAADLVVGRAAVWSPSDLVSVDASPVMFCWITDPLGNTDRVSGVGVVSSSFVLLGTKTHEPDRLEFGRSDARLQTSVAFFDLAGAPVSGRLSTSWAPPSVSRHECSQHIVEHAPAMVDTIRLLDCLWPPPSCACDSGERVLRERGLPGQRPHCLPSSSQLAASAPAHSRTAPFGTSPSQNATSSFSPIFAEPRQWPSHGVQSLATPQLGQEALREPSVTTSPGPRCADIAAACCLLRCQQVQTETRNWGFDSSFGRRARPVRLLEGYWGSNILDRFAEEKTSSAAANRWSADENELETSLRLDGQGIHQQSRERTRGWSGARLGRLSKELDHNPDSADLGLRN